jgi:serine/threonine protein kinase
MGGPWIGGASVSRGRSVREETKWWPPDRMLQITGALLYEMLTGLPPFYCRDREKLFEKIRAGDLTFPKAISDRAKSVLSGLLTRDPNKRLGSGPDDAEEIKAHPFFAGEIDFEAMMRGR